MKREEFYIQQDDYFKVIQWDLTAKYTNRFVWSREVFGKIKPYIDFLEFFVEIEWEETSGGF